MVKNKCFGRLTVLIFIFSALLPAVGYAPTGQQTHDTGFIPPDKNLLRVGVTTNSPPLIFRQGDKVVGLEADLARELAAYLGKSLSFVELKWEDQIPALLENRIDIIMSGMTITQLREVRISFSIPYFTSGQMALIRRKDAARFSTGMFSFTTSSAIGVIKDTTGSFFVETQFSSVEPRLYADSDAAVEDLIDKEIDMFIHDGPVVLYLASVNENKGLTVLYNPLTKEYLGWGIRKDNVGLLDSANNFLRSFNKSGKLSKIIKQRIPFAN